MCTTASTIPGPGVSSNDRMLDTSSSIGVTFSPQQQQQQQQQTIAQASSSGTCPDLETRDHLDCSNSVNGRDESSVAVLGESTIDESSQLKSLPRMLSASRIITTEETVCSSQSSNSPQRHLPLSSSGLAPPLISSSSGLGHESDDNETMIDSTNREISTGDVSLVRPYHRPSENTEPMVAITREESLKNETELEDEPGSSWMTKESRLLEGDDDGNNEIENELKNKIENSTEGLKLDGERNQDSNKNDSISETFDIATFPTSELLEMLTALLDKIVKSNDRLASANREFDPDLENFTLSQNNHDHLKSVLSFRGKHIPQISLEHYFQRIQKYCPTTNDVFLSLLVYFDRVSKKCNSNYNSNNPDFQNRSKEEQQPNQQQQAFVMDSHNIHRLLIAGVTVSTKFFSDFFYSNSRYARVGGISLQELNHLELQFLVLCDFELLISTNELQRYADLLYKFWSSSNEVQSAQDPAASIST